MEVEALGKGKDILEKDLDLALVRTGEAKLLEIGFDFLRFIDDVPGPEATDELVAEEIYPELDRILSEDLAKKGLEAWDLLLKHGRACEELVKVGGRGGHQRDCQPVVATLIILDVSWGADALDELFASILSFGAQISAAIIYLVDVKEGLEGAAQVDTEAAEQGLPEGVLLDSLARLGLARKGETVLLSCLTFDHGWLVRFLKCSWSSITVNNFRLINLLNRLRHSVVGISHKVSQGCILWLSSI